MRHALLIAALFASPATTQDGDIITTEEAWELGWPAMQGPNGNLVAPRTGAEVVDDLSNARLVWESEEKDFCRAKHTTGTFKAKDPADGEQKNRSCSRMPPDLLVAVCSLHYPRPT